MWFEAKQVSVSYGGIFAVRGVSLFVERGELVALIGPNGAGKTTLMRAISGLTRPSSGEIWFEGDRIDRLPPHKIVRAGIAHVPEGRHLFPNMTARENLNLGAYGHPRVQWAGRREEVEKRFPRLVERRRQRAGSLSGGEQQMLAIGRALMAKPKLLLLDEPSIGLAPQIVREIAVTIRHIAASLGVGVILVEQNATLALSVASRAYVLELGRITMAGNSRDLLRDERVQSAYLSSAAKSAPTMGGR